MFRMLTHHFSIAGPDQFCSMAARISWRTTIVLAALILPSILAATARADSTYSATLDATLTVSGFLDVKRNPISKPAGLTLNNINTFVLDEGIIIVEGDATGDAGGSIDVIAGDPFDLVAGDRFEFDLVASGTTVYPTGFSYASTNGIVQIVADNFSPDPVTILFDFDYDYALSTSVDDPALESAYAFVGYQVNKDPYVIGGLGSDIFFDLANEVENNASETDMRVGSFEVTLLAGQSEIVNALAFAGGDPFGVEVPEPTSWLLGAIGAALLSGAGRWR